MLFFVLLAFIILVGLVVGSVITKIFKNTKLKYTFWIGAALAVLIAFVLIPNKGLVGC